MRARAPSGVSRILPGAIVLIGIALAAAVYLPTLGAPYVFDDAIAKLDNQSFTIVAPWAEPQAERGLPLSGRPIARLSFAVTGRLGSALGSDPVATHRAANLALHIACALLIVGVLTRALRTQQLDSDWRERAPLIAAEIGAAWLLHPLQTEAVNYVSQRTEILVAIFYLATLYASMRAWDSSHERGTRRWMIAATLFCLLGAGTKEVIVTVPFVVILYDRAFRTQQWSDLRGRVPFYLALMVAASVTLSGALSGARGNSVGFETPMSSTRYLYTQGCAILHYARLTFWPMGQSIDYGTTAATGWSCAAGFLIVGAAVALTVVGWIRRPRWRPVAFLGAMFFLVLAPSSSVIPIPTEIAAERRMYLPLLPLLILVVIAAQRLLRVAPEARRGLIGAAAGIPIVLAGITLHRNQAYASEISIWRDAAEHQPRNKRAYLHLARALTAERPPHFREADSVLSVAMAIDSTDVLVWDNRAWIADQEGRYGDEQQILLASLRLRPTHIWSLRTLGNLHVRSGDPQTGIAYLERAASLGPADSLFVDLGVARMASGDAEGAIQSFGKAIQLSPADANALRYLGHMLTGSGRAASAVPLLEQAVVRDTRSALGYAFLAEAYAALDSSSNAARAAASAAQLAANDPIALRIAGRAMLQVGRVADAERYLAMAVAETDPGPEMLTELATARARLGMTTDAEALYRRALAMDSQFAPARDALKGLATRRGP